MPSCCQTLGSKVLYSFFSSGLGQAITGFRGSFAQWINPSSVLGVPGIFDVYRAGRITIANAPGTGVADDKAIYAYVPRIIKYYLGEEAIIPNVPTYLCSEKKDLEYVLEHMGELVVKAANESGGRDNVTVVLLRYRA